MVIDISIRLLQYNALIDLRSLAEKKFHFMMSPNSGFLLKVSEIQEKTGLNKDTPVIVMCRSGDRSSGAASLLTKAGYTNVYSVVDGFEGDMAKEGANKGRRAVNGWKNAGLPWSYNLSKNKMYLE